ncbi:MAG: hypothetical protein WCQ23_01580 [Candidatus Methanomethylophilaceae archaeon]|jgi:cell division protein FtsB
MNDPQDIESLKAEVKALRTEVKDLKAFIRAMYTMISEEDAEYEYGDYLGGAEVGRYNT